MTESVSVEYGGSDCPLWNRYGKEFHTTCGYIVGKVRKWSPAWMRNFWTICPKSSVTEMMSFWSSLRWYGLLVTPEILTQLSESFRACRGLPFLHRNYLHRKNVHKCVLLHTYFLHCFTLNIYGNKRIWSGVLYFWIFSHSEFPHPVLSDISGLFFEA